MKENLIFNSISMRLLTLLLCTLCLLSCEKQEAEPTYDKQDSFVRISLVDPEGNDLFVNNPSYKWIDTTKISVQYLGRTNQPILAKNGFLVSKPTSNLPFDKNICHINVFEEIRRSAKDEFFTRTIVNWNDNFKDTIECRFKFGDSWRKLFEIRINDYLYTVPDGSKANFQIIWDGKHEKISQL